METVVNVHEAKTHLSRLLERAARGETIVIARAGQPVARLTAYAPPPVAERRLGFMRGAFEVPADFDSWGAEEVEALFGDPDGDPDGDSAFGDTR